MNDVSFSLVEQAVEVLRGVANITPVVSNRTIDGLSGAKVFFKCENFQRVGAFKFRGAYHAVARLMAKIRPARSQPSLQAIMLRASRWLVGFLGSGPRSYCRNRTRS